MHLAAVEEKAFADGRSLVQVELSLKDEAGQLVCSRDEEIAFTVENGEILGIENGAVDDLTPYSSPARKTHQGRLIVYLRAGTVPGEMRLSAFRAGETARVSIPLEEEAEHD